MLSFTKCQMLMFILGTINGTCWTTFIFMSIPKCLPGRISHLLPVFISRHKPCPTMRAHWLSEFKWFCKIMSQTADGMEEVLTICYRYYFFMSKQKGARCFRSNKTVRNNTSPLDWICTKLQSETKFSIFILGWINCVFPLKNNWHILFCSVNKKLGSYYLWWVLLQPPCHLLTH